MLLPSGQFSPGFEREGQNGYHFDPTIQKLNKSAIDTLEF